MTKAYLEPTEIERLEEAAEYLRDKLLIRLLFHLGCRISEALGITVGDIDFNQGTVTIQHLKTRINLTCPHCGARLSKSHRFCPGCGMEVDKAVTQEKEHQRFRTLPVDEETLTMLKEYIRRNGPVSQNGKRVLFGINRHRAWQIVKECAVSARLPRLINTESGKVHNVSPHKLRDATTTMRYRKVSGEEQREWYEQLWQGGKQDG